MSKILLVEDDLNLSYGIEFALQNENNEVNTVHSLESAKEVFDVSSSDVDLILLDVMLPDGSGYDFCKYVRTVSDIPIIFLTACDEEVNIVMGLDMGADDYVTKPFRIRELLSRINAVIRRNKRSSKNSNDTIISGDIVIETLSNKVTKNGTVLQLTSLEYKLLMLLINNDSQVITRQLILEKLWDVDCNFVDNNTLSVYVRRLREKIEDNPQEPIYIVTVRGTGYKWNIKLRG